MFGCLGLLVILLGLGIPISSVGYHPKYSERWGVIQSSQFQRERVVGPPSNRFRT